jgi:hypothetical protein
MKRLTTEFTESTEKTSQEFLSVNSVVNRREELQRSE